MLYERVKLVEAVQWTGDNFEEIQEICRKGDTAADDPKDGRIHIFDGPTVWKDDWLILNLWTKKFETMEDREFQAKFREVSADK